MGLGRRRHVVEGAAREKGKQNPINPPLLGPHYTAQTDNRWVRLEVTQGGNLLLEALALVVVVYLLQNHSGATRLDLEDVVSDHGLERELVRAKHAQRRVHVRHRFRVVTTLHVVVDGHQLAAHGAPLLLPGCTLKVERMLHPRGVLPLARLRPQGNVVVKQVVARVDARGIVCSISP